MSSRREETKVLKNQAAGISGSPRSTGKRGGGHPSCWQTHLPACALRNRLRRASFPSLPPHRRRTSGKRRELLHKQRNRGLKDPGRRSFGEWCGFIQGRQNADACPTMLLRGEESRYQEDAEDIQHHRRRVRSPDWTYRGDQKSSPHHYELPHRPPEGSIRANHDDGAYEESARVTCRVPLQSVGTCTKNSVEDRFNLFSKSIGY